MAENGESLFSLKVSRLLCTSRFLSRRRSGIFFHRHGYRSSIVTRIGILRYSERVSEENFQGW